MSTITIANSIVGGGTTANDNRSITVDNIISASESVAAGKAGTAAEAGVMTSASHGFTTETIAVYWATGYRYGCTIDSYDTNTVTLSGGTGDALPTSGAVVLSAPVEIDVAFSGTAMTVLSLSADILCGINIEDAGGVELAKNIVANGAYQYDSGCGESNPVTGDDIVKANVWNKSVTAGTAKVLVGYNNA